MARAILWQMFCRHTWGTAHTGHLSHMDPGYARWAECPRCEKRPSPRWRRRTFDGRERHGLCPGPGQEADLRPLSLGVEQCRSPFSVALFKTGDD